MEDIRVLHRSEHNISRKNISQHALKVLYRLKAGGYWAFLVGGALRDLLRDVEPRDFDVVTNAGIDEIRKLFRNSKVIGKRFPIVHTYFGGDLVEVSSLKADGDHTKYELLHADAMQRDFTANSVFYDINDFKVIDPLGAVDHINDRRVVAIGNVSEKFVEDPIRMLRALKLEIKHGFSLNKDVEQALTQHASGLHDVGPGRRYEELTRIFLSGYCNHMIERLEELGVLKEMWENGSRIVAKKGFDFFKKASAGIPVHYSRGSYAKQTHTHLWLFLYLQSGMFDAAHSHNEAVSCFNNFVEPLGMPFAQPVHDALMGFTMLREGEMEQLNTIARESRQLLDNYLVVHEPEMAAKLEEHFGGELNRRKSRRGGHSKAEGGKRRRRRRPRGRRRKKATES